MPLPLANPICSDDISPAFQHLSTLTQLGHRHPNMKQTPKQMIQMNSEASRQVHALLVKNMLMRKVGTCHYAFFFAIPSNFFKKSEKQNSDLCNQQD